jgi:hypothetical protein
MVGAVRMRQVLSSAGILVALALTGCGGSKSSTSAAKVKAGASSSTTTSTRRSIHAKQNPHRRSATAKHHHAKPGPAPTAHGQKQERGSTSSTSPTSKPSAPRKPAGAPAFTRPLRATLVGQNHHPTAGKRWYYTVTARDAKGRALSGRVETEFTFQGAVVGHETPPTHQLKQGRLYDWVKFPARAVGEPLAIRVVVQTSIGSVSLDWPVSVRK